MIYPSDSITVHKELIGPSSVTLLTASSRTIVGVSIQQSGTASQSQLLCGTDVVAINYGKDFGYNDMNYRCSNDIIVSKTGQDNSSFLVTYVNYDVSLISTTTPIGSGNVIFGMGFIIFLLSFLVFGIFFSSFKKI